jgi:hypothetical protein
MVSWIKDFSNTYRARTGVYPGNLEIFAPPWPLSYLPFQLSTLPPAGGVLAPATVPLLEPLILSGSPGMPPRLAPSPEVGSELFFPIALLSVCAEYLH